MPVFQNLISFDLGQLGNRTGVAFGLPSVFLMNANDYQLGSVIPAKTAIEEDKGNSFGILINF